MNKPVLLLASALLTIFSVTNALAFPKEGKAYFSGNLGYGINNPKVDFVTAAPPTSGGLKPMDRGWAFDIGLGYYLLDEVRIALNPLYTSGLSGKSTTGKGATLLTDKNIIKQYALFANLYYDILTNGKVNPFVMIGLGYMRTEVEDRVTFGGIGAKNKDDHSKFAYQAGLGIAYHMSSAIDAELGWRFIKSKNKKKNQFSADDLDTIGVVVSTSPGATNLVTIGMRFTF